MFQANGLVERQNRTIKEKLLKVLQDGNYDRWPDVLDGVLFAHRTACHRSTGYSPYRILYGREPVLPIDVKYSNQEIGENEQFDVAYVQHVVDVMCNIRAKVVGDVEENIKEAQEKQIKAYNRRHKGKYTFKAGDKKIKFFCAISSEPTEKVAKVVYLGSDHTSLRKPMKMVLAR